MSKRHEHEELSVCMFGKPLGRLFFNQQGQLSFRYNDDAKHILSVAMPDMNVEYSDSTVEKWFFGVLPDSVGTRKSMSKNKDYGHNSVFGLLSDYGADLPGAVQVFPDSEFADNDQENEYQVVSKSEIAERLETMIKQDKKQKDVAWHVKNERWSLAGGQPKFALMYDGKQYYECYGAAASNVIVKPGVSNMDNQSSIEHITMQIAKESGIVVADSDIVDFEGISAIVVQRYDRVLDDENHIQRLHQEDFCQALKLLPEQKYMEGKNPTIEAGEMLKKFCDRESMAIFVDSLLFNYLIGGTDGHLKNHSLIHGTDGQIHMAPLYDIASQLPYMRKHQISHLALGIGSEKRIGRVGKKALSDLAYYLDMPTDLVFDRFVDLSEKIPLMTRKVLENSNHIPNIEEISATMLPRVKTNCELASKNLTTTHFRIPDLFGASQGFSLSDGDILADYQETLYDRDDDLVFKDPTTGVVEKETGYTHAPGEPANPKHKKVATSHAGSSRLHSEGAVYVSPHVRGGVKVSGYWRARPHCRE